MKQSIEIVGVVSDMQTDDPTGSATPEVYFPLWQNRAFSKHLVVRTAGDPASVTPLVRREIAGVDPTAAVDT